MSFDAIGDREIRERRLGAIYAALLVLAAVAVVGAIVWTYVA